ncbi:uncharacterized protein METZ01_LOCUS106712 [marine metagenome]|uniref:Uncharacterized protein n=1 Tax=marine metagenome TaxID=408172 RepID=A0A381WNT7_9ZZZZ
MKDKLVLFQYYFKTLDTRYNTKIFLKTIMLETWFCDNYNYHIIAERNKPLEMLVVQRDLERQAT